MPVQRILFTGDLLRPGPQDEFRWQNNFIQMFYFSLSPLLRMSTTLPVDVLISGTEAGQFDQRAFYERLGARFATSSWLPLYSGAKELPPTLQEQLAHQCRDALVIGFELPTAMTLLFERAGITYLDMVLAPIQFLDDMPLAFRSKDKIVMDRLVSYNITEEYYAAHAGLVRASMIMSLHPKTDLVLEKCILFCANTRTDRNLHRGDHFVSYPDFAKEVQDLASSHDVVFFKPHPYGFCTSEEVAFFRNIPGFRYTTSNIYWLMSCLPRLTKVVSLCSSASVEAQYFGVQGTNLVRPPIERHVGTCPTDQYGLRYVSVRDAFWNTDFWRNVIGHVVPLRENQPVAMPFKPNRLRNMCHAYGPAAVLDLLPRHNSFQYYIEEMSRQMPSIPSERADKK